MTCVAKGRKIFLIHQAFVYTSLQPWVDTITMWKETSLYERIIKYDLWRYSGCNNDHGEPAHSNLVFFKCVKASMMKHRMHRERRWFSFCVDEEILQQKFNALIEIDFVTCTKLTNQRGTFLTISRFSAGVRSSYQRSRLSRNAHSFKRLAAFSFYDWRELYDNVHVVRMLLSSGKVKRCCFPINLAHAWSYSSMYSDKFVPVFRIYESAWLIVKGRSSSSSTSFDESDDSQMSNRS